VLSTVKNNNSFVLHVSRGIKDLKTPHKIYKNAKRKEE
jgi:hypothetical protein